MPISAAYEDAATISTTEFSLPAGSTSLATETADGVYQLWLDLNALAAGDQFILRLYEKVQSGGTKRLAESWIFDGVQGTPHRPFPSVILMHGWDFTLQRLAGSDRSIGWSIRKVA